MTTTKDGRPPTKIRESEGGGAIIRGKLYIRVIDSPSTGPRSWRPGRRHCRTCRRAVASYKPG